MASEADFDLETLGELLSLLAHDLRNPLSALHSNMGYLRSALDGRGEAPERDYCTEEDVQEAIADAVISCDGLTHLIDNLELLGQNLRGTDRRAAQPVAVVALVQEVLSRCARVAESHGLQVEFDAGSLSDSIEIVTRKEHLSRALSNLVRNAIQHSPSGAPVIVRVEVSETSVDVFVLDQGSALPSERRELAFSTRGQVNSKSGEWRYGRGLSLLSANLAATSAGVRVASVEPPEGFRHAFVLTAARTAQDQA